ncbi:MAG: CHAP domain-containing protein [Rhodococcus fascians]|uniref:CHAP domain-containing protein n=1 Tax=Nocardiaceae TaxID=85025 RepID=UPI00052301EA|nr:MULTISPECIES: CHAP domain-containing protein [Rhodococcus]OZD14236.1 CHAP domain-containing protein [Rhodococcus sp. 06-156-3C]OZD15927.1 CHAP domain-containing protein [Rhodococcus sp. 06-156-4C]OZD24572.1 CHAP domain-containing protein [Rhodococcus sp. 06-156-3b]OZD28527.1 CHAP domain-containing protein [Rhodococcus sp. 06-156-4a]OZD36853.1 CHAP domain-containing protein [Rhodococcus sp. 06-156-3]
MSIEVPTAPQRGRRRVGRWFVAFVAVVVVVAGAVLWLAPSRYLPWDTTPFPDVDTSALTPEQAAVVDLTRAEHERQRPGTFYSEGVEEAWCANFVSWIMREAGRPLSNPHSGSWRIPGVYTLTEYYQQQGTFEPKGYVPSVGDVVLYDNSSWVGQHTNIVVAVDGDTATTVGGNELGKIRVHSVDVLSDSAIVGFGRLS